MSMLPSRVPLLACTHSPAQDNPTATLPDVASRESAGTRQVTSPYRNSSHRISAARDEPLFDGR